MSRSGLLVLAIAAGALLAHSAYVQPWTLDDAYISMRYADHLAQGHGLVFNPGERVEGYTNFLWVLILGGARAAGLPIEATAKALGLACGLACLVLTKNAHRFHPAWTERTGAVATLLLGTLGIFTVWAMSGMETALAALLVLLSVLLHLRSRADGPPAWSAASGVCCALATMTHPDLGLLLPVLLLDRLRHGVRSWGPFLAAFCVLYVPYFAWRWSYYGWLLPNTFYNKVGGTWSQVQRGFSYLGGFAWPALLLLAAILAGVASRKAAMPRVVLAYAALHTLYVLLVGGDVMPAFRFFTPLAPLGCLLAAASLEGLVPRPRRIWALVAVMVAFSIVHSVGNRELHHRVVDGHIGRNGCEVGRWLRDHQPPDTIIATNNIGGVGYCSGLYTLDMLGLTDEHIAHADVPMGKGRPGHEKHDGRYVLDREPDFIQLGSSRGTRKPKFPGDHEIWNDPRFEENYELRTIELPSGRTVLLYERIDRPASAPSR